MTAVPRPWDSNWTPGGSPADDVGKAVDSVNDRASRIIAKTEERLQATGEEGPPHAHDASPTTPVVVHPGTINFGDAMQQVVAEAALGALKQNAPQIQHQMTAYMSEYLTAVFTGQPARPPDLTINGQSLIKADARSRAGRTLLIGMLTAAGTAFATAVGEMANIDFTSQVGWTAAATLAAGSVVQAVVSYLARLKVTPQYEQDGKPPVEGSPS